MKRLLALVFALSLVSGLDIAVSISSNSLEIDSGDFASSVVGITNNGAIPVSARISSTGVATWMRIYPVIMTVQPGQTVKTNLSFGGPVPKGSYVYELEIDARETDTWETIWTDTLIARVVSGPDSTTDPGPGKYLIINTESAEITPGEDLDLSINLPAELLPADLEIDMSADEVPITTYSSLVTSAPVQLTLSIPGTIAPGDYYITGILSGRGVIVTNQTRVNVGELEKVELNKNLDSRFLSRTVQVYVENKGNVLSQGTVSERLVAWDRFVTSSEPVPTITRDGAHYLLEWAYSIGPGETKLVASYDIDYTPYALLAFVVLLAVVLIFQRSEPVEVKKKMEQTKKGKEGTELKIMLTVSNKTDREIKDVKIKDLIPKIAVPTGFEIVKPKAKKSKEGITLIWDLDTLKPYEERIFGYHIKLGFGVIGNFELPKSEAEYKL